MVVNFCKDSAKVKICVRFKFSCLPSTIKSYVWDGWYLKSMGISKILSKYVLCHWCI